MKKIITLCALAMPCLAVAETHHPDSIYRLDELVVSTTRTTRPAQISKINAPLKQVPITVNSVSAADIQLKGFSDPASALRDVAGVNAIRDYGAFHMFFVRGFYETLVVNDGMRDDRHGIWQSAPLTGLGSVERIEVLKGAASMQQGHSAIGGVINIVRKPTTERFSGYTRLTYGSYDTYRVQAGASGAVTNKLQLRADVEGVKSAGWRDNYSKGVNASLVAKYQINSLQSLQLSLYANKDNYGGDYGQPHYKWNVYRVADNSLAFKAGDFNPKAAPTLNYGYQQDDLGHRNLSAQLKYELALSPSWRLTNQAFVSFDDIKYLSTDGLYWHSEETPSADHPYYFEEDGKRKYTALTEIHRDAFAFDYDTRSIQNQLELSGKLQTGAVKHQLLFGYNYINMLMNRFDRMSYDEKIIGPAYWSKVDVLNPKRDQGDIRVHYRRRQHFVDQTHGISAQDYMKWGKFSLLAGLRLDYFQRTFIVNDAEHKTIGAEKERTDISNLALTYRTGLVYSPTEEINFYVSASNFYKPQKTSLSSEVIYLDADGKEMGASELSKLPPTKGQQFEVGTHLAFGKTLSLDASLYYLTFQNKLNPNLGQRDGKRIGGLVDGYTSRGFELEANYKPIDELGFQLSYAYTDARVSAYKTVDASQPEFAGNQRERSPKHRLTAWAYAGQDFGKLRLRFGLGSEYSSKAFTSDNNVNTLPAYMLMHGLASASYGHWSLQFNVNNLLNSTYYRNALYDYQMIPSEGRNMSVSLSYQF